MAHLLHSSWLRSQLHAPTSIDALPALRFIILKHSKTLFTVVLHALVCVESTCSESLHPSEKKCISISNSIKRRSSMGNETPDIRQNMWTAEGHQKKDQND
uniref:Secreted protein n=1 Tax=Steinernema glaseri TaxID=37863 RepID=A0A1I7ZPQ4_9BILA